MRYKTDGRPQPPSLTPSPRDLFRPFEDATMASLTNYQPLQLSFDNRKPLLRRFSNSSIKCGLRRRSRVLSKEAIQVVHALKLAKSTHKIQHVFEARLSRLLKVDVLDALAELQRQNEWDLSLKVFDFIRKEAGYETQVSLYSDMIFLLGRNKLIGMAEQLFSQLMENGLKPDTRIYTEMIGAYLQLGMTVKALQIYELMKASGCAPDKLTFMILIRNLEKAGQQELAASLKNECAEYVDSPEKFIRETEQKHAKRRSFV